ncbi:retrovirus-related pol polyprotein from transposon TNT 1-94 [Tanacetum coccineum]|uniref:Retrovirus-related pol polyprotein from transposon TNT 1-94 n=1 Tax=Tanacetum coccineum TaxID=301880 RepID=A0ABQ5HZV4_9ASTR
MGSLHSVQAAPKAIMGPPPVITPGSEICLGVDLEPDEWIKDSGCSKHMTGNQKLFSKYKAYNGDNVIFGSNLRDTSTYILNQILIRAILGKTPYELLRCRKHTLDYFRVFGSKCLILNTKDYLTKFDPKSYEGVFLGYSQNSKACIILNKHIRKVKEPLNVTFDKTPPPFKTSPLVDDDLDKEEAIKVTEKKNLKNDIEDETLEIDKIVNINESRNHPLENVIGNLNQRTLRSQAQNSKAYIILNKHTRKVEESLNVTFDETPPPSNTSPLVDDDLDEEEAIKVTKKKNLENDIEDETLEIDEIVNIKESRNHPLENVIGNLNQRTLISQAQNQSNFFCFITTIKPKNVNEALTNDSWIIAM